MPGAPATYGIALATYLARRTLEISDPRRFRQSIARANRWFESAAPGNLLDRAAMLLAMPHSPAVQAKCLDPLLNAQNSDGGWGPQFHMPSEDFDTAIVVLALGAVREPGLPAKAMARGREFLVSRQLPTGGWLETTRPSGQQSYAEHISTSAWALCALLTGASQ
jgi:squalene cyclase